MNHKERKTTMKKTTTYGAILAALCIAVLTVFAGAGAAVAGNTIIYPYTYVDQYTYLSGDETLSLWEDNGITKINFVNDGIGYYFTAPFTEGSYVVTSYGYYQEIYTASLPDAFLKLSLYDIAGSDIEGKTISKNAGMNIEVVDPYIFDVDYLLFTTPAGGWSWILGNNGLGDSKDYVNWDNSTFTTAITGPSLADWGVTSGQWYVQAHVSGTPYAIASGIPSQYLTGSTRYPFYVKEAEYSISVDKETVIRGDSFVLTITGTPTTDSFIGYAAEVTIDAAGLTVLPGQNHIIVISDQCFLVDKIPTNGEVTVQVYSSIATDYDTYTFTAKFYDATHYSTPVATRDCAVRVVNSITIDAELEDGHSILGNELRFFGVNAETDHIALFISSDSKHLTYLTTPGLLDVARDGTWDCTFTLPAEFTAGTYTMYAAAVDAYSSMTDVIASINAGYEYYSYATYLLTLEKAGSDIGILKAGWNFISVPKHLDASQDTAAELFGSIDTASCSILIYDGAEQRWATLKAGDLILPLEAYWIYSAEPATLDLVWTTEPMTPEVKAVYAGWNAVGISAEDALPAQVAFANVNWATALPWNVDGQKYASGLVKGITAGEYAETNTIPLGCGVWLYANENGMMPGMTT